MSFIEIMIATLPFFYFMFVASITPGPNNVMLAASGMNYGYRKTVPHMLGIAVGFGLLMFACMIGIGAIFEAMPALQVIMKICGAAYLTYLAWRVAMAGKIKLDGHVTKGRPLTFLEAFLFQFINPKAWIAVLASISALLPAGLNMFEYALIALAVTSIICSVSVNVWTLFGKVMARLFTSDKYRRAINIALAVLLIATIPMMVM